VAEWSKAAVLKTVVSKGPWVRILPSPPNFKETCLRGRKERFAKPSYVQNMYPGFESLRLRFLTLMQDSNFFEQIKIYLSQFLENAKGEENQNYYSAAAYVPFVGWLFVYIFRRNQSFCVFHAFQALKINLLVSIVFFILWFFTSFPPVKWLLSLVLFVPIVTDFLEYVTWVFLLSYSSWGAYLAYTGNETFLPFLDKLENFLEKSEKRKPEEEKQ
jgi:uncharacterized membrane protein